MTQKRVEIIGGGLAGLSLGRALVQLGVPTTVHEAGTYPRHRVCGEFIAGLKPATVKQLNLEALLADARAHREVSWFYRDRRIRRQRLAFPALAVSRHQLDNRLAQAFAKEGGDLRTSSRVEDGAAREGTVHANGRRRGPAQWLGLKFHAFQLPLESDLEFHLGKDAYVGLCEVENGAVNVCGLFRARPELTVNRQTALCIYLRAAGLNALADRLAPASIDANSHCAVAGLSFAKPDARSGELRLGDSYAMIPPFTGNGMAIAFQSAALAVEPLVAWSRGDTTWEDTVSRTNQRLARRLNRRLALAGRLHPFLLMSTPQRVFQLAQRIGLLPFRVLAGAVHG
jgi:menaquinone-9 beta-reductase